MKKNNVAKVLLISTLVICLSITSVYAKSKKVESKHKHKYSSINTEKPHTSLPTKPPSSKTKTKTKKITKWRHSAYVTAYTTRKKECGNSKGITASGNKAIPGVTASVGDDLKHLYRKKKPKKIKIEGFPGVWVITDTKRKGYKGIDLCIGKGTKQNIELALDIGRKKRNFEIVE